jgi:hypothetical protein
MSLKIISSGMLILGMTCELKVIYTMYLVKEVIWLNNTNPYHEHPKDDLDIRI